jgi:hypothetical protein
MNNEWPHLPPNINGINYELINEVAIKYKKLLKVLTRDNTEKKIELTNSDDNNIDRLIPPYDIPCNYEECIKPAAFRKDVDNKYYCWFHIHS